MKFIEYLKEESKNIKIQWSFPNEETMKADFKEYKIKEYKKWESRAQMMKMRFPLFNDFDDFKNKLKTAEIKEIKSSEFRKIKNLTRNDSIDDLKLLVSTYEYPRDVDSIYFGMLNGDKIPYPIIVTGKKGHFILAGNTRTNVAFILEGKAKALFINLKEDK